MNSNTCSPERSDQPSDGPPAAPPDDLAVLAAAVDGLAARDRTSLTAPARAERVLRLRRLADRLEGYWLKELAEVDAQGGAGADQGVPAASTASWLRNRLRMGPTPPAAPSGPLGRCSAAP